MTRSPEISEFLSYLGAERALSKNSLVAYKKDLEQYWVYCSGESTPLESATLTQLRTYVALLRRRGLRMNTIARKVSAIKGFYQFLLREEKITQNPAELLSMQIRGRVLPKVLAVEEIDRLLSAIKGRTDLEIRDRALFELWYATGARVSEMVELKTHAIDWKQGVVKIRGKGNRERLVPVHAAALEWCTRYRDIRHVWVREGELKSPRLFFLTRSGKRVTRQQVWKMVRRYAKAAKIEKKIWPHLIRHSFATHVLQGGADLRAVQELLGHRSIATTEIYTHLDIENLKVMQLKYHPRD